ITNVELGEALISGSIVDQAALQRVLRKVSDLGLALLAVSRVSTDEAQLAVEARSGFMRCKKACLVVDLSNGGNLAHLLDLVALLSAAGWRTESRCLPPFICNSMGVQYNLRSI